MDFFFGFGAVILGIGFAIFMSIRQDRADSRLNKFYNQKKEK